MSLPSIQNLGGAFEKFSWADVQSEMAGRGLDPMKLIEYVLKTHVGNTDHLVGSTRLNVGFAYIGIVAAQNGGMQKALDVLIAKAQGESYDLTAANC